MFSEGIQVQLDPEAQDRPLRRIAGVKVWPELGFTGSEQKAGGLRTCLLYTSDAADDIGQV